MCSQNVEETAQNVYKRRTMGVVGSAAAEAGQEPVFRLEEVHTRFGDNVVLEDIDLTLDARQVLVVIGPSGSGKSTLLR